MNCQLIFDWKSFAVLGASAVIGILVYKMPAEQAAEVLNNMFCATKAIAAGNSDD